MNAAIVFCLAVLAADTSSTVRAKVLYGTEPDQQHRADIELWISEAVAKAGSPLAQPYTAWLPLGSDEAELYSSMQGGRIIKGKATEKDGSFEVQISGYKIKPLKQTVLLRPGERRVVKLTDYLPPENVFIALDVPLREQAKQHTEEVKPEGPVYEKQGLALFFAPAKAAFTTGEPLSLDVTLKNVSAKDFTLLTAPTLTDQWTLQISEAEGDKRYKVVRVRMRRLDVRPGPLVLKAGDASRFQLDVDDNHGYQLIGGEAGANSTVEHLPSGKYTLVASHTCHGATANRELAKLPPLWVGGIVTKPVRLEIVDKAAMSGGDLAREEPATTVAASADTQAEAIQLAKEVDLPSLEKAEYANIKRFREGFANVLVADPVEMNRLREALAVQAVPPSAGEQLYQVTFYRGEKAVRGVWVYDYGEWGFTRRTGPHWTVGTNPSLPKFLDELIKKHENDVPKQRIVEYDPDWGIKICLEPGGKKLLAFDGQGKAIWAVNVEGKPATSIWVERGQVITLPEKSTYQVTSGKSMGRRSSE